MRVRTRFSVTALVAWAVVASSVAAQEQEWIRQFGTFAYDDALALAPDGVGGMMVGGFMSGGFVARYDASGAELWTRQFGPGSSDNAAALAIDGKGGVFATGTTDRGLGLGGEIILARYDSNGNQLWFREFGTNQTDAGTGAAPDDAGGVFVSGWTFGDMGGPNAGSADIFLARYNSAGDRLWMKQFGTSAGEKANALAPDGAGGVVLTGFTAGSMAGVNAGQADIFVARYDSNGVQLWIRQFGTSEYDEPYALAPDGASGVIVAGRTRGSLAAPNAGGHDVFLARYDADGNQLWVRQFGTSGWDIARGAAADGAGGVVVAGFTDGTLSGMSAGLYDVFLAHYDSSGNQTWIEQFGTSEYEWASAAAPDGKGGVVISGMTQGSLGGPNAGERDAFVARHELNLCYADCDKSTGNGVLDIFDFLCFQNSFVLGEPYACDCDTSTGVGVCDVFDFLCFQNAFVVGCP